jgi:hypothetical protein
MFPFARLMAISTRAIDALKDDLVSAGELRQIVADSLVETAEARDYMAEVIRHLLAESIEIGEARNIEGNYVKFIAWKGSITDRCERAFRQWESLHQSDREFAFWFCLRENVDEYET